MEDMHLMSDSVMLEKSIDFSVEVVSLCRKIKETQHESIMTNQLIRCATSIGANLHESRYAQSTADFISKMQIALKECHESEYWLTLLFRTGYVSESTCKSLTNSAGTIRRMLISSINTVKKNQETNKT